jgi:hypothetical protein
VGAEAGEVAHGSKILRVVYLIGMETDEPGFANLSTRKDETNMTTMMNAGNNGKVRQSLASELDRLDRMLDGLAEGLNEAVADAVKAAVGTAVREAAQAVLTEVLTNPEIRARLNGTATVAAETTAQVLPTAATSGLRQRLSQLWQGVRSCLTGLCLSCGSSVWQVPSAVGNLGRRMMRGLASLWSRRQVVTQFKYQLLTAVGVGMAAGTAAYCSGPWLAAGVSAVSGFVATLAVQAGLWLRRTFGLYAVTNA